MVQTITMPKLGQMVEESTIVRWLKREGEPVKKGELLFEMDTDKCLMEVESFFEGTLLKILAPEGTTVPVLSVVAYVGEPGDPLPDAPVSRSASSIVTSAEVPRPEIAAAPKPSPAVVAEPVRDARFRISPRARRLVRESVIDPHPIAGTGPAGRIVERDVQAYLEAQGYSSIHATPLAKKLAAREKLDLIAVARSATAHLTVSDVDRTLAERPKPLSRHRRAIAQRLTQSYTTAPHFFTTVSVDMTELQELRAELKAKGQRYAVTEFILKAVAMTLPEYPAVNSRTDGVSVWWSTQVNLGLAVAVEDGLLVPVIRGAERLSVSEIRDRAAELTAKARCGKLVPDEVTGSTFTVSNMGMMDVENFTAIINPGESAILAVSSILKQPVVRDDQIVIGSMMKMTLSADHRLIDGATAAQFLNALRRRLEDRNVFDRLT